MFSKKVNQFLFASLLILSFSSTVFINAEAKQLQSQGFDVSSFSSSQQDMFMPDLKFISDLVGSIKEAMILS